MPIHNFLNLLAFKGNANALENLFQEKLYSNDVLVKKIQKLTLDNLCIKFLRHYLGYTNNLRKDLSIPSRMKRFGIHKNLLTSLKNLRAGLILGEYKKVVYNIEEQQKYYYSDYQYTILSDYLTGKKTSTSIIEDFKFEISHYFIQLEDMIKESKLLKEFPSIVYDRFLRDYYIGEMKK